MANAVSPVTVFSRYVEVSWAVDPDHRSKDFYQANFDASVWSDIVVPGNWPGS
ncbi:hypothetical protein [Mucilaginibacter sp. HD30]